MLPILHPPGIDLNKLMQIQNRIAKNVKREDHLKKLETVAGCDISFAKHNIAWAACVVLDYRTLDPLDQKVEKVRLRFPYIPTFLAFRELEGMLKTARGAEADVYVVGAHGIAHPRRAGLACHLGVILDRPTFGVAKSKLCGDANMPPNRRGSYTLLKDGSETIGAVLRTLPNAKPVYVSVGNKISLKTAIKITLHTTRKHRLPEPIQAAHELATHHAKVASLDPSTPCF